MKLEFTKMHGAGNDYVYVDCFRQIIENPSEVAKKVSDRHKGIGSDGLILIAPSTVADVRMIMFNVDGSEGGMCGNGARCVAKYAYDHKIVDKENFLLETKSGIRGITVHPENGKAKTVTVDMLEPKLDCKDIPVKGEGRFIGGKIDGYTATCVSMGNPHCVIFTEEDISKLDMEKVGKPLENHPIFPDRANIEFVNKISETEFAMRVWERGSGETMACGTGASAVAVAAVLNGFAKRDTDITVHLLGGDLTLNYSSGGNVYMTGEAVEVFNGTIEI